MPQAETLFRLFIYDLLNLQHENALAFIHKSFLHHAFHFITKYLQPTYIYLKQNQYKNYTYLFT